MSCCCNNKCKDYQIYNINDLIDCNYFVNLYMIPQYFFDEYKKLNIFNFFNQEELKNCFEYINIQWKMLLNIIKTFFRTRKYITSDFKRVQCDIFNLINYTFSNYFTDIIFYLKSLNPENYQDKDNSVSIYTVNDEPERTNIKNTSDFMKKNIRNQSATDSKSNKIKLSDAFNNILEKENIFNKLSADIIFIIKNNLQVYQDFIYGFVCVKEIEKEKE